MMHDSADDHIMTIITRLHSVGDIVDQNACQLWCWRVTSVETKVFSCAAH